MQFYHEFVNFQIVHYLPNISTAIAIGLSSNHLWIFKLCVICKFFPHSSQLTCHPIIRDFSNCALFAKSFHINCNIEAFVNFQIVRFSPILSTFIAINLSSDHSWIIKLCVVRQIFPHSLQLTYHPIICVFSNEALFAKSLHIHRK